MIQRIQTIWLLLACLAISCLFFIPTVSSSDGITTYQITATGLYKKAAEGSALVEAYLALTISTAATAIMSFANIFTFKKRHIQKRILFANMVLIVGLLFWNNVYAKNLPGASESVSYSIGAFIPLIAVVFCMLALKGISNDEKLLRSADRLR